MKTKDFAEEVYDYFKSRRKQTGKALTDVESHLFSEAKKRMKEYPVSILVEADLKKLGYSIKTEDKKKMASLAQLLKEDYYKQLYWNNLDEHAQELGFEKANNCEAMMNEYFRLLKEGCFVKSVTVVVQYKSSKLPCRVNIAIEDVAKKEQNCIFKVKSIMDFKTYFDENNPGDFYIKQYVCFNCE